MSKDFEAMKAGKSAIWPKFSPNLNFCSMKNLPLQDFSIMTLVGAQLQMRQKCILSHCAMANDDPRMPAMQPR